jgi:hypothetical protein
MTTTTTTTTPILNTHPPSRRYLTIALAFAAGAALGVAATALISRDRAVTRAPGAEAAAAARTVAEHGSITAIEHRDQLALAGDVAARTVAEHGSITAIEHRDRLARAHDGAQVANRQHEQFRQNLIAVHDGRYRFNTSAD